MLVNGRIWYIWIVVIISEYWDWNWTTCMKTNEKILTWLQAIEIHSDVTPSYAMMRSDRRGLWWICNEFKPLPAYTTMVVSLWFSFLWFPKGVYEFDDFPMLPSGVWVYFILNGAQWWCFCPSIFPMGFLGLYFSVQSKMVSWALVSRIGLRGVVDGTVDGLIAWRLTVKVRRCTLGTTCVWVVVHLVHNHTTTQQSRSTISHN